VEFFSILPVLSFNTDKNHSGLLMPLTTDALGTQVSWAINSSEFYGLNSSFVWISWRVSDVSIHCGPFPLLLATGPVSCHFVYNFKMYGLLVKGESRIADEIYEYVCHRVFLLV
jgi:hypothetical protein